MSEPLDIAIIGMAGCYAGARDARTLWRNILNKVYAVSDATPEWSQPYLDPDSREPNRIYTAKGGWLHDLAEFDPREFGVMPNAVDGREPDHFLALKNARDALADAGYLDKPFDRERAGIVLGRGNNTNRGAATLLAHGSELDQILEIVAKVRPDFGSTELDALREGLRAQLPPFNPEMLPGLIPNITTGIIANRLDLMGPNYIVDAACASSLVAVEHAARELRSGRCDLMLSGGVHAQTPPQTYMIFSQINALARDAIRPFQKGANGTLLGEGCGVLVLKRLEDAERDGDRVYAVIKGMGVASDGKAKGLFAPRKEGQMVALRRAYESCGIDPMSLGLVEAHATGIALGDRTELRSLTEVFGARRGALPTIALGSVKSMISHAIPASGGASLIKTALALQQKVLPPTLCDEPAPELEIEKTPFYINNETRPWVQGKAPRRAGVDAFGFGGINAHCILEEFRPRERRVQVPVLHAPSESELVVLAAPTREALLAQAQQLRACLAQQPKASLAAIAKASAARADGSHRLAIVAADAAELGKRLDQANEKLQRADARPFKTRGGLYYGCGEPAGKLCVLFPGEGAQYPGMLADVCVHFPQARAWFDFLEDTAGDDGRAARAPVIFPPPTAIGADTRAQLEAQLHEMDYGAESVFTASMALHDVLVSLGLKADAMLGHSTGENTALTASKVRRFDSLTEIAATVRDLNRIYRELDARNAIVEGALLTVGALKPAQREDLLARADGRLQVAMDNCPNQLVLFGAREDIAALRAELSGEGAICVELPFGRAYHTELFKPIGDAYRRYFADVAFGPGIATLYSACGAAPFPDEPDAIRELVARQWESRVRFTETVQRLYADGYRVFVEAGPSGNLTSFVSDVLRERDDVVAVATNSRRKSGVGQLQHALAQLYTAGVALDPTQLFAFREIEDLDLGAAPTAGAAKPRLNLMMPKLHWPETMPVPPLPQTVVERPVAVDAPVAAQAPADPRLAFLQTHFSLMQEFLDSQARVMGLIDGAKHAVVPEPATAKPGDSSAVRDDEVSSSEVFPLLGEIVEHSAQRLVCERRYALDRDLFLRDHTIGGAPSTRDASLLPIAVIPFTFSMEILAEAAMRLVGRADRTVIAIEQARGNRWLSLDDDSVQLRIVAERESATADEDRVSVRLFMLGTGPQGGLLVFEGTVVLAQRYPAPPTPLAWSSTDERPPKNNPDGELYSHGMFHGPRLQGVRHVRRWGAESIDADLEAIATRDYFSFTTTPRFQFDAAMLDAAGQLAGYWLTEKHSWGFNCFPFRLGRFSIFAPPPAPGTRVLCRGDLRFTDDNILEARFDLVAPDGRVIMRADGWEDRKFSVPKRLYEFRIHPQRESMTRPWLEGALPEGLLLRRMEPFPPHFLDEGGAIWKRMLAHMVLSHAERRQFYALPAAGPRREEWLMGRIAAKDALRAWAARRGVALAAADVEIAAQTDGAPYFVCPALAGHALPQLSISHSRRWAVALLGPADEALGLDYQRLENIDADALIAGGLDESEHRWLAHADGAAERLRIAVALWCAKEAAAKALGTGLEGRPRDWQVIGAQLDRRAAAPPQVRVRRGGHVFDVALFFDGSEEVLAVCSARVDPAAALAAPPPSPQPSPPLCGARGSFKDLRMTSTLFIGLDGCTFTVLDEMTRELPGVGVTMPFMKRVLENGARAKLRSTPNPLTPPAWTSIQTGKGPGHHGVFDFIRAEDKGGEVFWTLYDARDVDAETIWSIASRKNKTIAALNFPLTAPPPGNVNGFVVPGFIPAKHLRRNTHPRELFERMKQDIPGFDPKELAWDFDNEKQALEVLSPEDTEKWVRYHLPREEQWFRIAEYILEHERPDLMAVMFDGTDKIQHQAWQFLDPALVPANPQGWEKGMREVCLEYFRNLDRYIERLVTLAGPEAQVFFASDHGFTASTEVLRINSLLEDLGYLKWAASDGSEHALRREASDFANLDWAQTTAYCRTPSSNGIHIRVAEKPGDPGIRPEDYKRFREKLVDDLFSLKDPETGERIIVDVLRREEWFPGPHMQQACDLTLVLRDNGFVSIRNYKPALVKRPNPAGTHHPDGIFIAYGKGVAAAGEVELRQIVDVAPTLLHSLGLPVPADLEGGVPDAFFTAAHRAAHPLKKGARTRHERKRESGEEMDESEKQKMIEQLQMLGYME